MNLFGIIYIIGECNRGQESCSFTKTISIRLISNVLFSQSQKKIPAM